MIDAVTEAMSTKADQLLTQIEEQERNSEVFSYDMAVQMLTNEFENIGIEVYPVGKAEIDVQQKAFSFDVGTHRHVIKFNIDTDVDEGDDELRFLNAFYREQGAKQQHDVTVYLSSGFFYTDDGQGIGYVGKLSPICMYRLGLLADNVQTQRKVRG